MASSRSVAREATHAREPEMTVREMIEGSKVFFDCDENGIPDSIDIRDGADDDVNGNGIIDQCDGDTSLLANYHNSSWRQFASKPDTAFFWTAFDRAPDSETSVWIRFTVPPGKHQVHVTVLAEKREIRQLVKAVLEGGSYERYWNQRDAAGHAVTQGRYRMRLTIDQHEYMRVVQWREM
jgi:hypothetical protein